MWELLPAEVNEVARHVQQVGQTVREAPEGCAYRSALPEEIEEQQQGQHAEPVGKDLQLDREPGRDDAESIEWWDGNEVEQQGGHLQEHEEGKGGPEVE